MASESIVVVAIKISQILCLTFIKSFTVLLISSLEISVQFF